MSTDRTLAALRRFQGRADAGKVSTPRGKAKKRSAGNSGPTEYQEQAKVCDWLKAHKIVYCAVPNGARFGGDAAIHAARLKRIGMKAGVPDLLIFEPCEGHVGCALEMKRAKGGRLSAKQEEWLCALHKLGWACIVGLGAEDAISQLKGLGYGKD